jgi:hypothetical protein
VCRDRVARRDALSLLWSVSSDLKLSSLFCARNYCHGATRNFMVLVAKRRFPPPWSVEELDACFVVRES